MTIFNDDDPEENTRNTDQLRGKDSASPENGESKISKESGVLGEIRVDPLQELRQNLYSEEQPQDPSKNDIFKRMTESLSSRKVPTQPRPNLGPDRGFGVRTAGGTPYEPPEKLNTPETDANRNTVIFQNGPKTDPFIQGWPKIRQADTLDSQDGTGDVQGPEAHSDSTEPKVRPIDPEEQEAVWKNYPIDQTSELKQPSSMADEKVASAQVERKRLPSGFDRQQQVSRYISYNPKRSFREQFNELSKIEKSLIVALAVALVGLFSLIAYLFIESRQPGFGIANIVAPESTPTAVVVSPPVPVGLVLPGGWSFELGSGVMVNGDWNPKTSEWLVGTEIRRVVAIPWNKQIEAVLQTFTKGDIINLQMSNGDSYLYKVMSVNQVPVDDTSILYDIHPTLAIILIQPDADKRWVVVAEPQ